MKNATLFYEKHSENPPTLYVPTKNGFELKEKDYYATRHPVKKYRNGGSSLVSTTEDYAIFADTLAAGGVAKNGYKLLKPESIEMMKKVEFDSVDVKNTFTCVQGTDYGYGLGVRVRTKALDCGIPVGEFGWDGAAGSYILVDTDNGISITMGMNVLSWPEIFKGEHLAIAKLIYEELI